MRNTGFTDSRVRCMFPDAPPMVGYAATARVRSYEPPMEGHSYSDRTDWWNHILSIPAPRVVVVEDEDRYPGLGAFVGDVHANILAALGCVGVVTNGAVRGLESVRALRKTQHRLACWNPWSRPSKALVPRRPRLPRRHPRRWVLSLLAIAERR